MGIWDVRGGESEPSLLRSCFVDASLMLRRLERGWDMLEWSRAGVRIAPVCFENGYVCGGCLCEAVGQGWSVWGGMMPCS